MIRVVIVAVAVAATGVGAAVLGAAAVDELTAQDPRAWFAPYVDVTLQPGYNFEDPVESPADTVVLSFVVAGGDGGCEPTWGTHYTLEGASKALDLDRRVRRLRERGGTPIVSFGGALNDELAVACSNPDDLAAAYAEVIDRYDLTVVDIDVEGAALDDTAANQRRAEALATLQQAARDEGSDLDVWLTLPVSPSGLPANALAVVDATVAADVDVAGVNVMTMNYGGSRPAGTSMWDATASALRSTWRQLRGVYVRAGAPRTDPQLWSMLGATPNIGQNDLPSDRFDLDDAERLLDFAARYQLGRVSMWSANRDGPCGAQVDANVYQTTCSGLDQEPLAFTHRFAALPTKVGAARVEPTPEQVDDPIDDPATSPYPVWRRSKIYEAGDKAVWHRDVYEAKWWTQGDLPDEPVEQVWDSPWRYLGPVLPGEEPGPAEDATSESAYPVWDEDLVYDEGDRVSRDGFVFEAKWWTTGDGPDPDPDAPWETPWEVIE